MLLCNEHKVAQQVAMNSFCLLFWFFFGFFLFFRYIYIVEYRQYFLERLTERHFLIYRLIIIQFVIF